jgi:hypothetical protein
VNFGFSAARKPADDKDTPASKIIIGVANGDEKSRRITYLLA